MATTAAITGTITGQETVIRAMQAIADGAGELDATRGRINALVVATARNRAPVRSGRLSGSIGAGLISDGVTIGSSLPYAGVIEWGWAARGIRGAHFLAGAIYGNAGAIVTMYEEGIAQVVARAETGEA